MTDISKSVQNVYRAMGKDKGVGWGVGGGGGGREDSTWQTM